MNSTVRQNPYRVLIHRYVAILIVTQVCRLDYVRYTQVRIANR